MQEIHEPSITNALAKSSTAAESSLETTLLVVRIFESPEVMEIYSDWLTSFMIYLRTWSFPEDKEERE
jgi:hypothetical protein